MLFKVVKYCKKPKNHDEFPAPTKITSVQNTFGERLPTKDHKERIMGQEFHYIYDGVKKRSTIQLFLPVKGVDDPEAIDKQVLELTDSLGLKCLYAVFAECYRQGFLGYCYWNANSFCDVLGYKRGKNGYHHTSNIIRVENRLRALAGLKYVVEIIGYDQKTGADKIVFEGFLLKLDDSEVVFLYKNNKRIAKGTKIRISDELYRSMFNQKHFAWFDRRFLSLDCQKHGKSVLLYAYYTCQLAMGAKQRAIKHIITRPISTTLIETGIVIDPKHLGRDRKTFEDAHKTLKQLGLIKDFVIDWSDNQIQITFDPNHTTINIKPAIVKEVEALYE